MTALEVAAPEAPDTLAALIGELRRLRTAAGQPSFALLARRVSAARAARGVPPPAHRVSRTTIFDCFRTDRSRLDVELLADIVAALGGGATDVIAWRAAYAAAVGDDEPVRGVEVTSSLRPPSDRFTGHSKLVDACVAARPGTTAALSGLAGAGKTEIAVQVASRRRDGQGASAIFVTLDGGDARRDPPDADTIVRALLEHVGVSDPSMRRLVVRERAELWGRWLREHDVVLVLDDAGAADQLTGAIPDRHHGLIIVTSRRRLELAGAETIDVPPLEPPESLDLLELAVGPIHDDTVASATSIAELCGHLPLELLLAAAEINEHPDWTLDDHVHRIRRVARGEGIRPALASTVESLAEDERLVLRRLVLHPGRRIFPSEAAALAGIDARRVRSGLDGLAERHLISWSFDAGPDGLVELHDLVREHAARLLDAEDSYRVQRAALGRLVVKAAARTRRDVAAALPSSKPILGSPEPDPTGDDDGDGGETPSADEAFARLASRYETTCDLVDLAISFELRDEAAVLVAALAPYLKFFENPRSNRVLSAGLATSDRTLRASLHRELAHLNINGGDRLAAMHHLRSADRLGPDPDPGRTHGMLGGLASAAGDFAESIEHYRLAQQLQREAGNLGASARQVANLGNQLRLDEQHEEAERTLREALALSRSVDDTLAVINETSTLGLLFEDTDRLDEAIEQFEAAIELATSTGTDYLIAQNTSRLAAVLRRQDRLADALGYARRSVAMSLEHSDRMEIETRLELAQVLIDLGELDEGVTELRASLDCALRLDHPFNEREVRAVIAELVERGVLTPDQVT